MSQDSPSDKESTGPQLHLERAPRTGSQREFDEVVPEFMHRAFYRSTEDEYQAVDPAELKPRLTRKVEESAAKLDDPTMKVTERPKPERTTPLPPPLRTSESSDEREPLEPLRSSGSPDTDSAEPTESIKDTVAVPLRTMPEQTPPRGNPPPSTTRQSGINFSIVAALLFVVGLFIWREQTRPTIPPEQPLPVPQNVQVREQTDPAPPTLGEVSPYPEMSPEVVEPVVNQEPTVEVATEETPETEDPEGASTVAEETPEDSTTYPSREASAQRAAIIDSMSDRTVRNMEKASRVEPPAPPKDTSLFPMEPPATQPVASPAEQPVATKSTNSEANATKNAAAESLFPTEKAAEATPAQPKKTAQPVATSKPPLPVNVSQPTRPGQGEPYEIAEPTF